ncbi:hypothetical protein TSTA_093930 [Talaromyces stipitatus ATCC 10500]|uniref:Uncharacterized protein n=1 Tax=Talaromyces stipitatus (strain ATCC 10500 / CBS 375.48 / QM 6759 / NRRL 1006) TaxID=441959 RepID=B8M1R0_TALSN|nr:uncharacterized protein TSTA_093930 [Talaromyces stipitatus ATCC 10500]EED22147.1 hypothetical protein TSTA_093930 [Talaromyces stipitatus ATCC 10500]
MNTSLSDHMFLPGKRFFRSVKVPNLRRPPRSVFGKATGSAQLMVKRDCDLFTRDESFLDGMGLVDHYYHREDYILFINELSNPDWRNTLESKVLYGLSGIVQRTQRNRVSFRMYDCHPYEKNARIHILAEEIPVVVGICIWGYATKGRTLQVEGSPEKLDLSSSQATGEGNGISATKNP